MGERIEWLDNPDWFLQPADRLPATVAAMLQQEPVFKRIFGDSIVDYKRMDFSMRELPALRVYNDQGRTDSDTWYLTGDLKLDIIFPASLRRRETQKFPDLVTSALLAMFRSDAFLRNVKASVPGLNELGKAYSWDKSLGFIAADAAELQPLTQITANFRILLEEWDRYLTSDDRTRDDPFRKTLGDLETLYLHFRAVNDAGETVLETVNTTIKVKQEE